MPHIKSRRSGASNIAPIPIGNRRPGKSKVGMKRPPGPIVPWCERVRRKAAKVETLAADCRLADLVNYLFDIFDNTVPRQEPKRYRLTTKRPLAAIGSNVGTFQNASSPQHVHKVRVQPIPKEKPPDVRHHAVASKRPTGASAQVLPQRESIESKVQQMCKAIRALKVRQLRQASQVNPASGSHIVRVQLAEVANAMLSKAMLAQRQQANVKHPLPALEKCSQQSRSTTRRTESGHGFRSEMTARQKRQDLAPRTPPRREVQYEWAPALVLDRPGFEGRQRRRRCT